jgi:hypothetical protein
LFEFEGILNKESIPTTGRLAINNHANPNNSYVVTLDRYPEQKARITYQDGR